MIDVDRAINVLKTERECCYRPCTREECGQCDLVMDAAWLEAGLNDAISLLEGIRNKKLLEQELLKIEQLETVYPEISCEMMYFTNCCCSLCGTQLIREDRFCRGCGKPIVWETN